MSVFLGSAGSAVPDDVGDELTRSTIPGEWITDDTRKATVGFASSCQVIVPAFLLPETE